MLNLKSRFVRKRSAWNKGNVVSTLVQCSSKCTHFVTIFFQAPSSILVSLTFTKVLMKDLARMLIHARKTKNCRVSFKMLLSVCLVFVENELWSCNFQNATFKKKLPQQWRKLFWSKCPFLPLVLNKDNNNKHVEYHDIFIPFKGQIYSKKGVTFLFCLAHGLSVLFSMFGWSQGFYC